MKHLNEQHTDSPIPTPEITEELTAETPADLASRLYARSFDLRGKFVDGRAKAFKRDFPGWFGAFEEVIGMLRDAADCIERQRRTAERLKETEARCEALRKACTRRFVSLGTRWHSCNLCFHEWSAADPDEKHAPDCLARPLPESQR